MKNMSFVLTYELAPACQTKSHCTCKHYSGTHTVHTYMTRQSDLDVGVVKLEENKIKTRQRTKGMMIQAAYQGYQPAPTGRVPSRREMKATRKT